MDHKYQVSNVHVFILFNFNFDGAANSQHLKMWNLSIWINFQFIFIFQISINFSIVVKWLAFHFSFSNFIQLSIHYDFKITFAWIRSAILRINKIILIKSFTFNVKRWKLNIEWDFFFFFFLNRNRLNAIRYSTFDRMK